MFLIAAYGRHMEGKNIGFPISHLVSHFKNMKRIINNQFQHQRNLALSEVFQIVSSEIVITLMYQLFPHQVIKNVQEYSKLVASIECISGTCKVYKAIFTRALTI